MAEFCLDCLNKGSERKILESEVILMDDLCEGCGQVVPCVVRFRTPLEMLIGYPWFRRRKKKKKTEE